MFEAMLSAGMWKDEFYFPRAGVFMDCITPPQEKVKEITLGPYIADKRIAFDVRKSDYSANPIMENDTLEYPSEGTPRYKFQVRQIVVDSVVESVALICTLQQ